MNFEQIIARMNAIVTEIRSCNDVAKIAELSKEYDTLDEQRRVIEEARSKQPIDEPTVVSVQQRGVVPTEAKGKENDVYATIEYRKAFMAYAQRGVAIPAEYRAGGESGTTVTTDIGAIIPTTIMNEFIKNVSKVYGQVYAKVRKLNIKGGVKFPISNLSASFKWINESTTSGKQKAGDIKTFVEFSYHMGEIRIATSLLANIVSLDVFETEVVRILVEAYVKAMDEAIINGTGSGQPLGITKDTRVTNVVELTDAEISDWTAWRKKLFARIPLSKRGMGEFLFPASTVESYLLTMKDTANRPIFKEATEGTVSNLAGKFYGRDVTLVEPELIKDFDTAVEGDVIGIFGVFTDYALNTNLQMTYRRYFDEASNEYIDKALVVVDGKVLDPSGFYLIKKKNTAAAAASTLAGKSITG